MIRAALVLVATLATGVLPVALATDARAQSQPPEKVYRIGFLSQGQPPKAFLGALQQGLRERGYVEGRNLAWEFRSTDGSLDQLPQMAEELVRLKVDLILARASSGAASSSGLRTSVRRARRFSARAAARSASTAASAARWANAAGRARSSALVSASQLP